MKTISLDAMRRTWCAMPTPAFLLLVALVVSVQDMHASGSHHDSATQGHVEMLSSAHDSGAHHGSGGGEDCSVSSCSPHPALFAAEHPPATGATTPRRPVAQRAAPSNPVERLYRPPILPA